MKERFELVDAKIVDGKDDKQYGIFVVKSGLSKVEVFAPVKKVAGFKEFIGSKIEITFELEIRSSQSGKQFFAAVPQDFEIVG